MSFPRYPKYKDSGVEWLGEVPEHWEVLPPKWHLKSAAGGNSIKGQCASEPQEGLFPGFSASGQDVWLASFEFNVPGIVLSAVGARCGKTFKAEGQWGVVANTHCLFPKQDTNRDYCWYFTNQEDWWEKGGSAQPFVKVGDTLARKWVFPPLREQTAIAAFLDRETAKIDELVAEQERLMELLKEKRQAVISHAVTKGLNPNAPMKPSGIEWLGDVPAHWRVGKCGFYATILSGFAFPSSGFTEDESQTKLLRGINVGVGTLKWAETVYWRRVPGDDLDLYEMKEGDVVLGMDRPIISEGIRVCKVKQADLPCLLLQRVASIKTAPGLRPDYLLALLSSEMFAAHFAPETTGVSVPHISPEQIQNFIIPVPPAGEQEAITALIASERAKIDGLTEEAQRAIDLLAERRTALISAAVTGQINVRGAAARQ